METGTSSSPIKRRLTAILAADAVGYSRQMSENEERTLKALAAQRAIIDRIIAAHGGRIVSTAGDSVLAEFSSSVEAVRCAVEIQEGLDTRNASLPETDRLLFRIGVNLGDVMVDGADILGDGVNVAARLEGIADPGGICISSSVYDQIAGKLNLGFIDIGEKSLKNISRPIRVYRFDRSGELAAIPHRSASPSRTLWIGMGAVAALAIAAVGVWRSGSLEQRTAAPAAPAPSSAAAPSPPVAPATAPVATAQPPEAASEETKLKLRIAEAERAKAEADLARSRADAEAAKQRARAERAAPPSAPAQTPPSPAAVAKAPIAAPSSSTAPPSSTAAAPAQPNAPQASAAGASPARVATGNGTATRSCEAWQESRAFNDVLPARVADGEIVIERGVAGQVGYTRVSGRPTADGRLLLVGSFISTLPRLNGREFPMRFEGTYSAGQYSLSGYMGSRNCTVVVRVGAQQ